MIRKFLANNKQLRLTLIDATEIIREITQRQGANPIAAMAIGRLTTGEALLASNLGRGQRISLSVDSDGILGQIYADADYVLRHYHFPERLIAQKEATVPIRWVPNGWAGGIGPADPARHQPFAERHHDLFFAGFVGSAQNGQVVDERVDMLDSLRANKIPATVILSEGFGQGLGPGSYAAYMGDTKLALVPGGNSPETIRLYDALECGALPVVLDRPWLWAADGLGAMGPPPLITIESWRDLPGVVSSLEAPITLSRAAACRDWWARFKAHAAETVANLIETAFAAH